MGVLICDVMGHGVRAALVAGMMRAITEQHSDADCSTRQAPRPLERKPLLDPQPLRHDDVCDGLGDHRRCGPRLLLVCQRGPPEAAALPTRAWADRIARWSVRPGPRSIQGSPLQDRGWSHRARRSVNDVHGWSCSEVESPRAGLYSHADLVEEVRSNASPQAATTERSRPRSTAVRRRIGLRGRCVHRRSCGRSRKLRPPSAGAAVTPHPRALPDVARTSVRQ